MLLLVFLVFVFWHGRGRRWKGCSTVVFFVKISPLNLVSVLLPLRLLVSCCTNTRKYVALKKHVEYLDSYFGQNIDVLMLP